MSIFAKPVRATNPDPDAKLCPRCRGAGVRPKTRIHRCNGIADACSTCGGDGVVTRPIGGW